MTTQPDFEELLRLIEKHKVDYMIVGGYAIEAGAMAGSRFLSSGVPSCSETNERPVDFETQPMPRRLNPIDCLD